MKITEAELRNALGRHRQGESERLGDHLLLITGTAVGTLGIRGFDREDYQQEALLACLDAAERYDDAKKSLYSYFYQNSLWKIMEILKNTKRRKLRHQRYQLYLAHPEIGVAGGCKKKRNIITPLE